MDKVWGNCAAIRQIETILQNNRLGHAYLICGPEGVGKRAFARWFAMSILCRANKAAGNIDPGACGSCTSCTKLEKGSHPDVFESGGQKEKNSLHIKSVRELKPELYTTPNESEYKINLIYNIQAMTTAAANALLKVLEEPPEHIIFIMTCDNKQSLPPTIVSRVTSITLAPLEYSQIVDILTKAYPDSDTVKVKWAANASGGIPDKALSLMESEDKGLSVSIAQSLYSGTKYDTLTAFNALEGDRQEAVQALSELREILASALRESHSDDILTENIASYLTMTQISTIIERLDEYTEKLQSNSNVGLTLTVLADVLHNM